MEFREKFTLVDLIHDSRLEIADKTWRVNNLIYGIYGYLQVHPSLRPGKPMQKSSYFAAPLTTGGHLPFHFFKFSSYLFIWFYWSWLPVMLISAGYLAWCFISGQSFIIHVCMHGNSVNYTSSASNYFLRGRSLEWLVTKKFMLEVSN